MCSWHLLQTDMIEKASLPKILVYSTDLAPNLMLSESGKCVIIALFLLRIMNLIIL